METVLLIAAAVAALWLAWLAAVLLYRVGRVVLDVLLFAIGAAIAVSHFVRDKGAH